MEIRPCRLAELLTTEILIEILIRIPLENILVCRGVCKSWNDLILQHFFAELHRSFSSSLTIMLVHHLRESQDLSSRTTFGLITSDQSSCGYSLKFTDKVIQNIPEIEIIGSCNGLICLSSYDEGHYGKYHPESLSDDCVRLLLCNPISGSHLILPDPPQTPEFGHPSQLGFGYIPSTGEYKAVKLIYMEDEGRLSFYVCTIQGDGNMKKKVTPSASVWREICDNDVGGDREAVALPELSDFYSYSTFFKGSIIWVAGAHSESECHSLIYFDIEKEEMQTLTLPPTIFRNYDVIDGCNFDAAVRIGVYYDEDGKDHLYLCEELDPCANIWVMEDYKSIDSLKLKWVVPLPLDERMPVNLFRVLKDGKLLIGLADTLAYYDPATTVIETMENMQFPMYSYLAIDKPNLLGCLL